MKIDKNDYSDKCTYVFKAKDLSDFELKLVLEIKNKLILHVFNKAKSTAFIKQKINVSGDINIIDKFKVDEQRYFPVVRTAVNSIVLNIYKLIRIDGITILSDRVKEIEFTRNDKNNWNINVFLEGMYVKK